MRGLATVFLALLMPLMVRAEGWIGEIDIPLMPGLRISADGETVFETSAGRIVEVIASGLVAPEAARRYYATALPGLGWQSMPGGAMMREDEKLEIELVPEGDATVVIFRLSPKQ